MGLNRRTPSEVLEQVVGNSTSDRISIYEIKIALHERGFGLLMIIFAAIMIVMPPGLTIVPGLPISFFAIQMMLGKTAPWLPTWLEKKTISRKILTLMIKKGNPYLKKVEKVLRPRISFASSPLGERIVGLFAFVFSISIAIPLPLTNFLPAIGVILMSMGILGKDGVLILIGMLVGTVGVSFTAAIVLFGEAILGSFF